MKDSTKNIVEKATTLFMRNGLQAVSMDDIASHTGISKKTLYRDFRSKELMVRTIVQKLIAKTSKYIRLCPGISPNAVKEMENFSGHILDMLEITTPKFVSDLKNYYPETYSQLVDFRDSTIIPYLESCLNRGVAEEIFRPDMNRRNTGWLYCWQIQHALEGDTTHAEVSEIVESANDLFLHGIRNSRGLKLVSMTKQNRITRQKGSKPVGVEYLNS